MTLRLVAEQRHELRQRLAAEGYGSSDEGLDEILEALEVHDAAPARAPDWRRRIARITDAAGSEPDLDDVLPASRGYAFPSSVSVADEE